MKTHARWLGPLALVAALSLGACGTESQTALPAGTGSGAAIQQPGGQGQQDQFGGQGQQDQFGGSQGQQDRFGGQGQQDQFGGSQGQQDQLGGGQGGPGQQGAPGQPGGQGGRGRQGGPGQQGGPRQQGGPGGPGQPGGGPGQQGAPGQPGGLDNGNAPASNVAFTETSGEGGAVTLSGGYATDPRDHGRPVALIAAALGVPEDVFREAFSHVTPAAAGEEPSSDQVRRNKAALLEALAPYGVTNERLDEVSNYYRYNRNAGEMWRHTPATVRAVVTDGVVTGAEIVDPGSGYTEAPTIVIGGRAATATIAFSTDFASNGALISVALDGAK